MVETDTTMVLGQWNSDNCLNRLINGLNQLNNGLNRILNGPDWLNDGPSLLNDDPNWPNNGTDTLSSHKTAWNSFHGSPGVPE